MQASEYINTYILHYIHFLYVGRKSQASGLTASRSERYVRFQVNFILYLNSSALFNVKLLLINPQQITRYLQSIIVRTDWAFVKLNSLNKREVDFASWRIFAYSIIPIMETISDRIKLRLLFSAELRNDERSTLRIFPFRLNIWVMNVWNNHFQVGNYLAMSGIGRIKRHFLYYN